MLWHPFPKSSLFVILNTFYFNPGNSILYSFLSVKPRVDYILSGFLDNEPVYFIPVEAKKKFPH